MSELISYQEFVNRNILKTDNDKRKSYQYEIQVYDDNFRFTLAIPPGGIIEDDFDGLYKRKALYEALEDDGEIYNWLKEVHESILQNL